ncbi:hypothetical protein H0H81_009293 [Sphagnurus paluster]|uniref:Casein kinase substrate phosphoprotein PP28 domain-containing protein n=1 Tax=Sphagnurus paluster TaxID=117069 RepID=A0A9P7KIK4_9AGAR|nr:hypothetical protein H0H81_009293 [Sphagnurus paluster]
MVRGTGKFKQKRGGGRNFRFVRLLQPQTRSEVSLHSKVMTLDADGTAVGHGTIYNRRGPRNNGSDNDDSDSEEDDSEEGSEEEGSEGSEEESDEDAGPTTASGAGVKGKAPAAQEQELSRTERRDLKRKQAAEKAKAREGGADEDDDLINPNHVEKKLNISDLGAPRELSRREREQKEKADAKERYWKLHAQGKTQEAKSDLSRLAKIRAEREAAQAKRKAEADAKATEIEQKRQAQLSKRG